MRNRNAIDERRLTRRKTLASGLGWTLGGLTFGKPALAGLSSGVDHNQADLYAFPGSQAGTVVIALAWQARVSSPTSQVRIHAGSRSWNFRMDAAQSIEWYKDGLTLYTAKANGNGFSAVVMEGPFSAFSGNATIELWAELLGSAGSRRRIGSSFLAGVLARDPPLAADYHSRTPAEDKSILTTRLAGAIAKEARSRAEVVDPEAHGRRLASILLPDVLRFNPALPAGFTFAAQNGRHPHDSSGIVVNSILKGYPASFLRPAVSLEKTFPYFS